MLGLILKDLLASKKYLRTLLFLVVFYFVFGIMTKNIGFSSYMVLFLSAMMIFATFSFDEQAKWDNYAISLPLTRKDIVLSKYVISLGCSTLGSLIALISNIAYSVYTHTQLSKNDFLIIGLLLQIAVIFCSIILPVIFQFGIEKSRLILLLIVGIPFFVVTLLMNQNINLPSKETIELLLYLSPVITLAIVAISISASISIFSKKDF